MNNRIFYQDFLFRDLPLDENDNPKVQIIYLKEISCLKHPLSFDKLLKMDKESEWEKLLDSIKNKDVVIIDDVYLENQELYQYKKFYLASYFHIISTYSSTCEVVSFMHKQMELFD